MKKKPSLLVCYDYQMAPWEHRVPYSSTFLLHQALRSYFDVFTIGEKNERDVDVVFNMLPLGQNDNAFRKGKLTFFWNPTPLEGGQEGLGLKSDVVFVASHLDAQKAKQTTYALYPGLNPHYQIFPQELIYDVGFLGSTMKASRVNFLAGLRERFTSFEGAASSLGEASARRLSETKLVLSIQDYDMQKKGIENRFWSFGNVRPILMYRTEDLKLAGFKEDEHFIGYQNADECYEKIEYYLQHMDKAEEIWMNLRKELALHHTYNDRAKQIWEVYKKC
jgi:hypothetical protein